MVAAMRSLAVAALLALTLTACGGSDGDSGASDEPEGVDLSAAVDACQEPVQDSLNKATFNEDGEDEELDPQVVMRLGDDGDTVSVSPLEQADFLVQPSVDAGACVLRELDAPDSVLSTVGQATGLSGQQETKWEGVDLTYSYNGNIGFSGVFTKAE